MQILAEGNMPIVIVIFIVIGAFFAGNSTINPQAKPTVTSEEIKAVTEEVETITPSFSPTPIPQHKIVNPTPLPTVYDPIVDCGTDWQKANGKTAKTKKSVCDSFIDCQMYGGIFRFPKDKCDSLVTCQLDGKTMRMTSQDCEKYKGQLESNRQRQNSINEDVKKQLHEKTLRDAEQLLIQNGYSPEEIIKKLQELDQDLKAQGL